MILVKILSEKVKLLTLNGDLFKFSDTFLLIWPFHVYCGANGGSASIIYWSLLIKKSKDGGLFAIAVASSVPIVDIDSPFVPSP